MYTKLFINYTKGFWFFLIFIKMKNTTQNNILSGIFLVSIRKFFYEIHKKIGTLTILVEIS